MSGAYLPVAMKLLRAFFLRHRVAAFAVIALALAMKALVPAGYMIGSDARVLTVQVCDGYAEAAHDAGKAVVIAVKGHGDAGKATHDQQACPYSGLTHAGLTELIAPNLDRYVALAVELAQEPVRLAGLRAGLRPRLAASPLCAGESFVRHVEAAVTAMGERYLSGQPPEAFSVAG